jgi:hypothetical protein
MEGYRFMVRNERWTNKGFNRGVSVKVASMNKKSV